MEDPEKLEKNPKRHLEKETSDVEDRNNVKKAKKKKSRTTQERAHEKQAISTSCLSSDPPFSEDFEEDWSVCSAKQCQQPEGNEVSLKWFLSFLSEILSFLLF